MKRRNPFGLRATRLLAYENARPSETRCSPLCRTNTQGLRRLRFPFFISQCQRASGREAGASLPNPRWKQIPHLESMTAGASLEKVRANSASVRKGRAVAYKLAGDASNPARSVHLRLGIPLVKGRPRKAVKSFFSGFVITRPHSCPIAPTLSPR